MQQTQPALYESMTKNLNTEEQSIIQGVIQTADNLAMQEAQAQQLATEQQAHAAGLHQHPNGVAQAGPPQ